MDSRLRGNDGVGHPDERARWLMPVNSLPAKGIPMIIDVHAHTWSYPEHFGQNFIDQAMRAKGGQPVDLSVSYDHYRANCPPDTRTIVFGGKAKLSDLWVPDEFVAQYVNQHPDTLIGFMSIDPTQDGWKRELEHSHQTLGLRGIKLLPMYAGFYPQHASLDPLWDYAQKHQLPVLLHTGTTFIAQAPIDCTLPRHLDMVASRYPECRIILAHLGHPYEGECVAVIRKHPHLYADISALFYRPWQLYNSLMLVQEYGVWGKVLFGTDYPFTTVNETIAGVQSLNAMLEGTALPRLKEDEIAKMIHRDALGLLGLA